MAEGIILQSASKGATQEDIDRVLANNGLEKDAVEEEPTLTAVTETEQPDEKAEEAETVEASTSETEEEPKVEEKPRLSRTQRKVQRATERLARENEDLKKRLDALERGEKPAASPKAEENPRPKRESFKSQEEYEDALLAWGTKTAIERTKTEEAQAREREMLQANYESYRSDVEEFRDTVDDWDEVVGQSLPIHTSVYLAIMEDRVQNPAAVVYYLGKHPDYTKKLGEMSPLSAAMEVESLSKRLARTGASSTEEAPRREPDKPRHRIPPPVRTVNAGATTPSLSSREAAAKGSYRDFKRAQRAGR